MNDQIRGLSADEVRDRVERGLENTPVESASKTVGQIVFSNVFTYFNLFFCVLAVCVASVGAWFDLTFMGVVIINSVIGIVQELRSKRTLDKLTILTAPKGTVVRDGTTQKMDVAHLVLDDVVIFRAGDQIYADAVVLDGECKVNEALVTGEADEIDKKTGDELLSGSFIVAGVCYARLTAVGKDSFASKLTIEAKHSGRTKKSEMMRSLSRLVAVIGVISIPLGVALLYKELVWLERDARQAVTSTVAALVGMIPEGLYLLTSIALAAGVLRLSRKRTLVHEMACIETLARVDVLCVDKTGTITEPDMTVDGAVAICPERFDEADIKMIMTDYCAAIGDAVGIENDTMRALCGFYAGTPTLKASRVVPFTSSKKYGGVEFDGELSYLLGAPDVLLGGDARLTDMASQYAKSGKRVLLLCLYDGDGAEIGVSTDIAATGCVMPIAFILLSNKIRENAPETFSYFADQGVSVRVISGDNHLTVSEVAKSAGIEGAERAIDARTLTTDEAITDAAQKYVVFGRVTPEQKKKLVLALKAQGHTVAMTGDGVNDVLALKEADCSIAMASGSAVAGQAANIVLLDSDFAALPAVVDEGRRVINNIERSASLYLVKNIFSFVLSLVTLFFTLPYPVTPSQLTLVNMCTIGIPSFILAMEPNGERVRGRFMRTVIARALPAALADIVIVIGLLMFHAEFDLSEDVLGFICTVILGVVGLHMVDRMCRPYRGKPIHVALTASMTVMFFAGFLLMNGLVTKVAVLRSDLLIMTLLALLGGPALDFFSRWQKRIVRAYGAVCDRLKRYLDARS